MNYDPVARFYDPLSRLVFGRAQMKAQVALLDFLPQKGRVLIAGGGTGWILKEIAQRRHELHIDYVEPSGRMLDLARQKSTGKNSISFHPCMIEDFYPQNGLYDAVLTFFLFDNFTPQKGQQVFTHLNPLLKPGGVWLYADFIEENSGLYFWQKFLFRLMYSIFRFICRVEASHMPDVRRLFAENYVVKEAGRYYGGFIERLLWMKR